MEPVEHVFGRVAEKQTRQAAARHGAHDDHVGMQLIREPDYSLARAAFVHVHAAARNPVRVGQRVKADIEPDR